MDIISNWQNKKCSSFLSCVELGKENMTVYVQTALYPCFKVVKPQISKEILISFWLLKSCPSQCFYFSLHIQTQNCIYIADINVFRICLLPSSYWLCYWDSESLTFLDFFFSNISFTFLVFFYIYLLNRLYLYLLLNKRFIHF